MEKKEYLKAIGDKHGISMKKADLIINEYLKILAEKIADNDKVTITNFGSFQKTLIEPKVIFSPVDGHTLKADSYYRLTFSCARQLSERLKSKIKRG